MGIYLQQYKAFYFKTKNSGEKSCALGPDDVNCTSWTVLKGEFAAPRLNYHVSCFESEKQVFLLKKKKGKKDKQMRAASVEKQQNISQLS